MIILTPDLCKRARAVLGWSRELLAEKAGVSMSTVVAFEREVRAIPTERLQKMAHALSAGGLSLEKLKEAFER